MSRPTEQSRPDLYSRVTSQIIADLERGGFLAGEAMRVHRVHQRHVAGLPDELADDAQRVVEIPLDRNDASARNERLEELAGRDLALGQDDDAFEARGRRIGGR